MQTLWARVAQVRGACRCPQCVPGAHGIVRRNTASATRTTPRYFTTSTLWYSGIFAAAATFDAGVKKQRREQWDHAIAKAEQELAQVSAPDHAVAPEVDDLVDLRLNRRFSADLAAPDIAVLGEHLDSSALRTKLPDWPANTGAALTDWQPPQSIYASQPHKEYWDRVQWYPKKLETVRLSIDMLQLRLFLDLDRQGWTAEAASAVPDAYGELIRTPRVALFAALAQKEKDINRLCLMERESVASKWQRSAADIALCDYAQDDSGDHRRITRALNATLQELFKLREQGNLTRPQLLAKIAYNLSISSAPPDVDTYNTLILGFWRAQEFKQANDAILSLNAAHVRPNEVSLAAILGFHAHTGHHAHFLRWVRWLRGKEQGLFEAARNSKTDKRYHNLLLEKESPRHRPKTLWLPTPTPMVFSALIKGILKFGGFKEAWSAYEEMRQEGWGLCMRGLSPLLKDCARRGDWTAGLAVWEQMQALRSSPGLRDTRAWARETIGLPSYASMLQLCAKCDRRDVFDAVMKQATQMHPVASADLIKAAGTEDPSSEAWELLISRTPDTTDANDVLLHAHDGTPVQDDERNSVPHSPGQTVTGIDDERPASYIPLSAEDKFTVEKMSNSDSSSAREMSTTGQERSSFKLPSDSKVGLERTSSSASSWGGTESYRMDMSANWFSETRNAAQL